MLWAGPVRALGGGCEGQGACEPQPGRAEKLSSPAKEMPMPPVRRSVDGWSQKLRPVRKPEPRDRETWLYPECDRCFRPVCAKHASDIGGQLFAKSLRARAYGPCCSGDIAGATNASGSSRSWRRCCRRAAVPIHAVPKRCSPAGSASSIPGCPIRKARCSTGSSSGFKCWHRSRGCATGIVTAWASRRSRCSRFIPRRDCHTAPQSRCGPTACREPSRTAIPRKSASWCTSR